MPDYQRIYQPGGTYFFTVSMAATVIYQADWARSDKAEGLGIKREVFVGDGTDGNSSGAIR